MFNKPGFVTAVVTGYLVLYYLLFYAGAGKAIIGAMLCCAPLLILWLVMSVLKEKNNKITELGEQEEFGYSDKDKDSLNVF